MRGVAPLDGEGAGAEEVASDLLEDRRPEQPLLDRAARMDPQPVAIRGDLERAGAEAADDVVRSQGRAVTEVKARPQLDMELPRRVPAPLRRDPRLPTVL